MLYAAALSVCSLMPGIVDEVIMHREFENRTEIELLEYVDKRTDLPDEVRTRAKGAIFIIYSLPKGSNYASAKAQILLVCNKRPIRYGNQRSY